MSDPREDARHEYEDARHEYEDAVRRYNKAVEDVKAADEALKRAVDEFNAKVIDHRRYADRLEESYNSQVRTTNLKVAEHNSLVKEAKVLKAEYDKAMNYAKKMANDFVHEKTEEAKRDFLRAKKVVDQKAKDYNAFAEQIDFLKLKIKEMEEALKSRELADNAKIKAGWTDLAELWEKEIPDLQIKHGEAEDRLDAAKDRLDAAKDRLDAAERQS